MMIEIVVVLGVAVVAGIKEYYVLSVDLSVGGRLRINLPVKRQHL